MSNYEHKKVMESIGSESFYIKLDNGFAIPADENNDAFKIERRDDSGYVSKKLELSRNEIDELINLLNHTKELL